jgi:hypothetical protein
MDMTPMPKPLWRLAALRMRRHRQRHCDGYRSFQSDYRRDFSRSYGGDFESHKILFSLLQANAIVDASGKTDDPAAWIEAINLAQVNFLLHMIGPVSGKPLQT